ncbi:unnamed protein product [Acanthoscelides obtectus]|nr:unnamed protein product [Acanthoscelides obtectus]CAH2016827.1 unnamed protein product [Acanthoscelides obtectus]CAK1667882.1 Histidine triad nucleotide-binding protein 3 [Acanthoscelides obtectus]CAK1667894.1 Histidine triad nucleotide-binding protein 3 [Acanthoscelides obtectus]
MSAGSNCIFCKIISGESPGEILLNDNETVVFKDIKPAAKHHYLAVPKEHIINVNYLTSPEHKDLLEKLITNGKRVVEERGGDINDIILGFHCPPFNSISHLHLHVISPKSDMGFFSKLVFKPNTWWFQTVDGVLEKLEKSKI